MTPEERARTVDFILEHQAQLTVQPTRQPVLGKIIGVYIKFGGT